MEVNAHTANGSVVEVEQLLHRYAVQTRAAAQHNVGDFLRKARANGQVAAQDLQTKARAGGLLEQDQPISQSKPLRGVADKLGVRRFQKCRQWWWALPGKRNRAGKTMVDKSAASAPEISSTADQMITV